MLETVEIETGPQPDAAIIWLHGLGADGYDFEPIVPQLVSRGERAWRFIFPHAPHRAVTLNGGRRMRAWYDIKGLDRKSAEDTAGFEDSYAKVQELIAQEAARGIPASRIVLAGFSQGGAVSLYTVPRMSQALAGVMALSCYVPAQGSFAQERKRANDATRIFMAHGRSDATLPMSLGTQSRDFLRSEGYIVDWQDYPMAHSVCPEELIHIREFLHKVLA